MELLLSYKSLPHFRYMPLKCIFLRYQQPSLRRKLELVAPFYLIKKLVIPSSNREYAEEVELRRLSDQLL